MLFNCPDKQLIGLLFVLVFNQWEIVHVGSYLQGGQKTDCFWQLITLTVGGRNACDMSKFSEFYLEKEYKTFTSVR